MRILARLPRPFPCKKVYEDEWALAFHDIAPAGTGPCAGDPARQMVAWADFAAGAGEAEIAGFVRAVGTVAKQLGLEAPGYRLLANMGPDSGQEVAHLHVHVFGGRGLGRMLAE